MSGRLLVGTAAPHSTPLDGDCLGSCPSLRARGNTVAVGEAIQTRRPPHWIASLGNVPLARNDGRRRVLFRKRQSAGKAAPHSTPLDGYCLASGPASLRTRRVKQSRRGGLP
ncbi:MAG: hypothetical protein LBT00_14540 [Spirochaetaceae bacterium]|nr:hypothetical protein [Spirochaetaceae bacterium]